MTYNLNVAWDKGKKILSIKDHILLKEVATGQKTLYAGNTGLIQRRVAFLVQKGLGLILIADPGTLLMQVYR